MKRNYSFWAVLIAVLITALVCTGVMALARTHSIPSVGVYIPALLKGDSGSKYESDGFTWYREHLPDILESARKTMGYLETVDEMEEMPCVLNMSMAATIGDIAVVINTNDISYFDPVGEILDPDILFENEFTEFEVKMNNNNAECTVQSNDAETNWLFTVSSSPAGNSTCTIHSTEGENGSEKPSLVIELSTDVSSNVESIREKADIISKQILDAIHGESLSVIDDTETGARITISI